MLPHLSYSAFVVSGPDVGTAVVGSEVVLRLALLLLLLVETSSLKTHARGMAPQAGRVADAHADADTEPGSVQTGSDTENIVVGGKRVDLGTGVEVGGIGTQGRAMGGTVSLGVG